MKFKRSVVIESKTLALKKIEEYLSKEDIEAQFGEINGDYFSKDKFLVSWNDNWKTIPSEFSIDKTDSFYASYSGYKAIYATRSLFHEKQLGGYDSIERALLEVGLKLCITQEKKVEFFNKYVVKYNEKITQNKQSKSNV